MYSTKAILIFKTSRVNEYNEGLRVSDSSGDHKRKRRRGKMTGKVETMRWMIVFSVLLTLPLLVGISGQAMAAEAETVTVFAAASTTNAVTEIGQLFENGKTGKFRTSFASSSTLAKQIEQGAPADVFISADKKWMDYLETRKMIEPDTRFDLLGNRIVLIAPKGSPINRIDIRPGFDLVKLLSDGRLAMGDPDHVPAGIYGMQALEKLGVWSSIEKRVARAKDVRAALALVERGETPLGLVYSTDAAISDKVKVVGVFPNESHPPIVYPAAIVAGRKSDVAGRFIGFLKSPEAKAVFEKYGFTVR
jgi:molybdate transport system substrate-binding protein